MKKVELMLGGLNCAHCAGKIEEQVKNKSEIEEANLNFVNKKLSFRVGDNHSEADVLKDVVNIIDTTEPGLSISYFDGSPLVLDDVSVLKENKHHHIHDDHEEGHHHEEGENDVKLLFISIALYIVGMLFRHFNEDNLIFLVPLAASYLISGREVILTATRNIARGDFFDENFLMTVATIGAIAIGEYPEAVGVMLFYNIGEILESRAVNKSRKNIEVLMNIKPEIANLKKDGRIIEVSPEKVDIGDIIVVKVGEKVPLDGIVIKGESRFDTSAITGESVLRTYRVEDEIQSGIINKNSVIEVEVKKRFEDSTVAKILDMVENATSRKSKTENFITVFARYYTPVVVGLAVLIAVLPPLVLGDEFSKWLYRGLIFLVVSCPCALVLSIPLSYFSGIGVLSRNGVLMKGSNYIEAVKNMKTLVLDKTGTLTKGVFKVNNIAVASDASKEDILKYAFIAESKSNHPIATSISSYFEENYSDIKSKIDLESIEDYEEISARGIRLKFDGKIVLAGNERLLREEGIDFVSIENSSTKVYIAYDGRYLGCVEISDELKEGSIDAIDDLKKMGVDRIVMLTGDGEKTAKEFSEKLGIDEYFANLLPEQKVERLEEIMKSSTGKVAFVGDGINDAPVIARSDIGISMGGVGSDAAIEASDVVIMTDEISNISKSIDISRFTSKIVWQNIIMAIGIKVLVMILSVFGLANMWMAIFADVGVTFIAVLNSLRILAHK